MTSDIFSRLPGGQSGFPEPRSALPGMQTRLSDMRSQSSAGGLEGAAREREHPQSNLDAGKCLTRVRNRTASPRDSNRAFGDSFTSSCDRFATSRGSFASFTIFLTRLRERTNRPIARAIRLRREQQRLQKIRGVSAREWNGSQRCVSASRSVAFVSLRLQPVARLMLLPCSTIDPRRVRAGSPTKFRYINGRRDARSPPAHVVRREV